MSDIIKELKSLAVIFVALAVITGVVYPLAVFVIGQLAFPHQANGSIVHDKNGNAAGSALIGQQFTGDDYFWSRPSYTAGYPYNPLTSAGSNYGPTNKKLIDDVTNRTTLIRHSTGVEVVSTDLVMGSASGLDPDISLEAALIQVYRVAHARGLSADTVEKLVRDNTDRPLLGFGGDEKVNVLTLNLALDQL